MQSPSPFHLVRDRSSIIANLTAISQSTISKENTRTTTNNLISKDGTSNIKTSIGSIKVADIGGDVPGVHDAAAGEVALGLAGQDGWDTLEYESVRYWNV